MTEQQSKTVDEFLKDIGTLNFELAEIIPSKDGNYKTDEIITQEHLFKVWIDQQLELAKKNGTSKSKTVDELKEKFNYPGWCEIVNDVWLGFEDKNEAINTLDKIQSTIKETYESGIEDAAKIAIDILVDKRKRLYTIPKKIRSLKEK